MKYQITGKNISVTDSISNAIQSKLKKMDKYFLIKDDVECRCVVSAHNDCAKIEVTIFLPNVTLRAEVSDNDLYAAIDLVIDKLERQMAKVKARMDRSSDRLSFARALDLSDIEEEKLDEEKDIVVRTKSYNLMPMTLDEAILRMEALGHDFFLYLDKEDDLISVVYVRKDGGYGVIQAENQVK